MRKIALIVCLTLCILAAGTIAMAQDQTDQAPQQTIPNYTELPDEDSNGRAVHLDIKEGEEELSAVEQKVIRRDTIQSNPTLVEQQ
jgi:hypothetical protein